MCHLCQSNEISLIQVRVWWVGSVQTTASLTPVWHCTTSVARDSWTGILKVCSLPPHKQQIDIECILLKGPYLPCVSMAGRALLAGYHRIITLKWQGTTTYKMYIKWAGLKIRIAMKFCRYNKCGKMIKHYTIWLKCGGIYVWISLIWAYLD